MPELTVVSVVALLLTGFVAGVCNAVAGGGTLFTFPAFLAAGVPPVMANASNAVAVWPGHALAVIGYRGHLSRFPGSIRGSMLIALLGGMLGAWLLTVIDNHAFSRLIPFLILAATLLFAFGSTVNAWLQRRLGGAEMHRPGLVTRLLELAFAIYGGFFGAGLGIMFMAGLQMLGVTDLQINNALKNLLAAIVTTVAVAILAMSGLVSWPHTVPAFLGAVAGGLVGGQVAPRLSAQWLREMVIGIGLVLTVYYFRQYYLASA